MRTKNITKRGELHTLGGDRDNIILFGWPLTFPMLPLKDNLQEDGFTLICSKNVDTLMNVPVMSASFGYL